MLQMCGRKNCYTVSVKRKLLKKDLFLHFMVNGHTAYLIWMQRKSWIILLFHQHHYDKKNMQGIIFLVSHCNLLCTFDMTAIPNIFCVAVSFHRSVQNFIWNIYPSAEIANQIWGGNFSLTWLSSLSLLLFLFLLLFG